MHAVKPIEHLSRTITQAYSSPGATIRAVERDLGDLAANGVVDVTALAEDLGVSEATVRRDLRLARGTTDARAHPRRRRLERRDVRAAAPVQGGAAPAREDPDRREAAGRVADGSVVGLTGGTTTTEVARDLLDRTGLTVVTNALNIAGELAIRSDLKLVVTGGTARPESYELVGPLAERTLEEMHLDVAIVGADGIALDEGLTTHHEVEAHTNRVLLERARAVMAVADSSKLGLVAFAASARSRRSTS